MLRLLHSRTFCSQFIPRIKIKSRTCCNLAPMLSQYLTHLRTVRKILSLLLLSSIDDASSCHCNSEMSFCNKQWMRCSVSLEVGYPVVHHTGRLRLSMKVHSHPAYIEVEKVQLGQLDFLLRRFTSHPRGLSDERSNVLYVTRTRTSPVSLTESFYFKVEVLLLFCFSKAVCGMRRQFDQDGGEGGENLREASHCRGE